MHSYEGSFADINLDKKSIQVIKMQDNVLRSYIGGLGIGARILYDRVKSPVSWDDSQNCVIIAAGPLNGTSIAGSGAYCVITKGPLTGGVTSAQANGFLGAYLRRSGLNGLIIHGKAQDWVYLYVKDGGVEIRDADFLKGLDTIEVEKRIKKDVIKGKCSVASIGPAGENQVMFSALVGDEGHVAAHNGPGAVLGSKRVKAIVVDSGGKERLFYNNKAKLNKLSKDMIKKSKNHPVYRQMYEYGTSFLLENYMKTGVLPARNLRTNEIGEEFLKLSGEYYRNKFELKRLPCWACPFKHCHRVTVTEGPYKGFVGEEPEYELFAGFGPNIGNSDPGAVVMLSDLCDRLGMDGNETSWLVAFVIECYEKRILNSRDLDGLRLESGNVEDIAALLKNISNRKGVGDLLAQGVMRAAEKLGKDAEECAVYVKKGHAPRGHDHRARWFEMFDTATSNTGTIESTTSVMRDPFSPEEIVDAVVRGKTRNFVDSLVVCMFPTMTMLNPEVDHLVDMVNAVTGWDYSPEEAYNMSLRVVNLLRAFNIRQGITPETEMPSVRYGSIPVDGPEKGRDIMAVWNEMLKRYYSVMGWDLSSGKPFPETLRKLGLEEIAEELWNNSY